MPEKGLKLKDTIILFDRDSGLSIFQNFRGYENLIDDAEWLLERVSQKSRGFLLRPISNDGRDGLWIGEYDYNGQIIRQDTIFDRNASLLSKLISDCVSHKITEKEVMKKFAIKTLKKRIKSKIIQDFKYYVCPIDRFYHSCIHIENVYEALKRKYGKSGRIPYSMVAKEIANTKPCEEVTVCPLILPNSFEKVLNLNRALKSRKLGEIRFISSDMVEII